VRVLVHTDVTKYLEFKAVDGSYVLSKTRVEKVGSAGGALADRLYGSTL
jgi:Rab GDP dissociation inhibitor